MRPNFHSFVFSKSFIPAWVRVQKDPVLFLFYSFIYLIIHKRKELAYASQSQKKSEERVEGQLQKGRICRCADFEGVCKK